jgi:hypothetical protein
MSDIASRERISELMEVIDMIAFNCPSGVVEFKVAALLDLKDEIERLTRHRDTYRQACATKQDLIDRILLQSVPGELSAERKAELSDRPRVTRAELAKSRLEIKHAERSFSADGEHHE